MKCYPLLLVAIIMANFANAQFIQEKSINAQIGFASSAPYDSTTEFADTGFFLQGEFILKVKSWFELRPYAGLVLTKSDGLDFNNDPTFEKSVTRAMLIGGKVRVRAPIPYFAPYIELGLGSSIGKFETLTTYYTIDKKGLTYHIPVGFGVELGRHNNVDLGLGFYFQNGVKQGIGALAIGITIPLKS